MKLISQWNDYKWVLPRVDLLSFNHICVKCGYERAFDKDDCKEKPIKCSAAYIGSLIMNNFYYDLMPSEVGRIILSFLEENGFAKSAESFIEESPELQEIVLQQKKGLKVRSGFDGYSLVELLNEFFQCRDIIYDSITKHPMIFKSVTKICCLRDQIESIIDLCIDNHKNLKIQPHNSGTLSSHLTALNDCHVSELNEAGQLGNPSTAVCNDTQNIQSCESSGPPCVSSHRVLTTHVPQFSHYNYFTLKTSELNALQNVEEMTSNSHLPSLSNSDQRFNIFSCTANIITVFGQQSDGNEQPSIHNTLNSQLTSLPNSTKVIDIANNLNNQASFGNLDVTMCNSDIESSSDQPQLPFDDFTDSCLTSASGENCSNESSLRNAVMKNIDEFLENKKREWLPTVLVDNQVVETGDPLTPSTFVNNLKQTEAMLISHESVPDKKCCNKVAKCAISESLRPRGVKKKIKANRSQKRVKNRQRDLEYEAPKMSREALYLPSENSVDLFSETDVVINENELIGPTETSSFGAHQVNASNRAMDECVV